MSNAISASPSDRPVGSRAAVRSGVTKRNDRLSLLRTITIAFLLISWEGIPFSLVDQPLFLGKYLVAFALMPALFLRVGQFLTGRASPDVWEWLAISLFAWCFLSSLISSTFFFPQPLYEWLPAMFTVTPILAILLFRILGCNLKNAIDAFYYVGLIGSVVVALQLLVSFPFIEYYVRDSGFGTESRIVFLKLPTSVALVISVAYLVQEKHFGRMLLRLAVTGLLIYNLFIVSESRLVIGAVAIACCFAWIALMSSRQRLISGVFAGIVAIMIVPYVIDRFFGNFESVSQYSQTDASISYRVKEVGHFKAYFDQTNGVGFGYMSRGTDKNNILAFSASKAGWLYGAREYGMGVDDIGILSALYQFGYIGLALVLIMTLMASLSLIRLGRTAAVHMAAGMIGFLIIGFMISPWPMNFFTLEYSGNCGGVLWFLAAEAALVRAALVNRARDRKPLRSQSASVHGAAPALR